MGQLRSTISQTAAGLFDRSSFARLDVRGPDAAGFDVSIVDVTGAYGCLCLWGPAIF